MKKILLVTILLFFPTIINAQSMVEIRNANLSQQIEEELNSNTNSLEIESIPKETTTIRIEVDLPDIKILPSHPLYRLKRIWEDFRGWFIFDPMKKLEYQINLANRRLEEVENLAKQKKADLITETTDEFNEKMKEVNKNLEKAKAKKKNLQNIYNLLDDNLKKHQSFFNQLADQVPEDIKNAIAEAKDLSRSEIEKILEKINQYQIKEKFLQIE